MNSALIATSLQGCSPHAESTADKGACGANQNCPEGYTCSSLGACVRAQANVGGASGIVTRGASTGTLTTAKSASGGKSGSLAIGNATAVSTVLDASGSAGTGSPAGKGGLSGFGGTAPIDGSLAAGGRKDTEGRGGQGSKVQLGGAAGNGSSEIGVGGATGVGGIHGTGGLSGTGGAPVGGGSNSGPLGNCGREHCGERCSIPTLPEFADLTSNEKLPDPFTMLSGQRMTEKQQWECRRAEIVAQAQKYELGVKTPKPVGAVTASVSDGKISVGVGGQSFTCDITLPSTGKAPYAAIIALNDGELDTAAILSLGVASISCRTYPLSHCRGSGLFSDANGAAYDAGDFVAWAWSISRLIDALEATPAAQIDPKRLGITGCSRSGKGALMIGALDQRIQLTIPQESGPGGIAAWRVAEAELAHDLNRYYAATINDTCSYSSAFEQFFESNATWKLPYDHHEVLGMVAPRGLLIIENSMLDWSAPVSCATSATAARMIYQGLGVTDNIGFTASSHNLCVFNQAEAPYIEVFIQKFLLGNSATDTKVWNMTARVDQDKWIDWSVPSLD